MIHYLRFFLNLFFQCIHYVFFHYQKFWIYLLETKKTFCNKNKCHDLLFAIQYMIIKMRGWNFSHLIRYHFSISKHSFCCIDKMQYRYFLHFLKTSKIYIFWQSFNAFHCYRAPLSLSTRSTCKMINNKLILSMPINFGKMYFFAS